jgi:hypothetical protein
MRDQHEGDVDQEQRRQPSEQRFSCFANDRSYAQAEEGTDQHQVGIVGDEPNETAGAQRITINSRKRARNDRQNNSIPRRLLEPESEFADEGRTWDS